MISKTEDQESSVVVKKTLELLLFATPSRRSTRFLPPRARPPLASDSTATLREQSNNLDCRARACRVSLCAGGALVRNESGDKVAVEEEVREEDGCHAPSHTYINLTIHWPSDTADIVNHLTLPNTLVSSLIIPKPLILTVVRPRRSVHEVLYKILRSYVGGDPQHTFHFLGALEHKVPRVTIGWMPGWLTQYSGDALYNALYPRRSPTTSIPWHRSCVGRVGESGCLQ